MLVLEFGADANAGEVLHTVCMHGHTAVAEFLIENGADFNVPDDDDGWTPLHCACSNGHLTTVAMLLDKGDPQC
jgi:ankyrin repeat protein